MIEVLSLVLVLITGFYAWVTYRMLQATEATVAVAQTQLQYLSRPYITVRSLTNPNSMIYLEIRNTGHSAALNVRFHIDKDFYAFGDKKNSLAGYNVFRNSTDSFPPDSRLLFYLGIGSQLFNENRDQDLCPLQFVIKSSYQHGDTQYEEETPIDLRMHLNTALTADPSVDELKAIRKTLKGISQAISKIG